MNVQGVDPRQAWWESIRDPKWLLQFAKGHLPDSVYRRKHRLFLCALVRDDHSWPYAYAEVRFAVGTAEAFADARASSKELAAVHGAMSPSLLREINEDPNDPVDVHVHEQSMRATRLAKAATRLRPLITAAEDYVPPLRANAGELLANILGPPYLAFPVQTPCEEVVCPDCEGRGRVKDLGIPYGEWSQCEPCKGVGRLPDRCDWFTPLVRDLAEEAYWRRTPEGLLDPQRLCVLADAIEDAGCDPHTCGGCGGSGYLPGKRQCSDCSGRGIVAADIPGHLRKTHSHYAGDWAVDLIRYGQRWFRKERDRD